MGKIQLKGMEFYAYHGYYEEEQKLGNKYGADIAVETNVEEAAENDNLKRTVNYELLYAIVSETVQEPAKLLETIAKSITSKVLSTFPEVKEVEVTIRKYNPPVGGVCQEASVTLFQHRK